MSTYSLFLLRHLHDSVTKLHHEEACESLLCVQLTPTKINYTLSIAQANRIKYAYFMDSEKLLLFFDPNLF